MAATTCLACKQAIGPGKVGAPYEGESTYGLPLEPFWLCADCVAAGFAPGSCAVCKQPEAADKPGNGFNLKAAAGPAPGALWLHNECAPLAGAKQGVTQAYLDEMARANR